MGSEVREASGGRTLRAETPAGRELRSSILALHARPACEGNDESLPKVRTYCREWEIWSPGRAVLRNSSRRAPGEERVGNEAHEGEGHEGHRHRAQELQRRSLDMALKVKGMYASDDHGLEEGLAKLGDRLARAIERSNG